MKSKVYLGIIVILSFIYLGRIETAFGAHETNESSPKVENQDGTKEIIVSATRLDTPREKVASSVTIISGEELEKREETSVSEALEWVPGIDRVQTGGFGSNSSIFIRGANSEHTLVLIDGVEANNPISPTRAFNFADLGVDNIERIEILRGPQSTLYGSDALGGVVQIITKKGSGPPKIYASGEAGSYDTYRERAGLSGGTENTNYSFSFSRQDTNGISSASAKYGNKEDDSYDNTSFSTRLGFLPSENIEGTFIGRFNTANSNIDNTGGFGGDDPNRLFDQEQFFTRGEVKVKAFENSFEQVYGISYSDQEFDDDNDPDLAHPGEILDSTYRGKLLKLDLQNVVHFDSMSLVVGLETEEEKGSSELFTDGPFGPFESDFSEQTVRTNGYYGELQYLGDEIFFGAAGIRADDNDEFGTEVTWKIAPGIQLPETGTRFIGTVGSGFKAPSLFQLYSEFGRLDLEPETSFGFDVGIEQPFFDDAWAIGGTFFWNKFDDLITFDPQTFLFDNISEAKTEGFEFSSNAKLTDDINWKVGLTLLDTEDESTGEDLLRRAKSKVTSSLEWNINEKASVSLRMLFVGNREDNDFSQFPPTRVELGSYTIFDVYSSYQLTENVKLFVKLLNLFDREYEEVLGFGTPGLEAYGGVKVSL